MISFKDFSGILNEAKSGKKYNLRELLDGSTEFEHKYALTYDMLLAVYQALYSTDVSMFVEFCEKLNSSLENEIDKLYNAEQEFLLDRLFSDVSDKEILACIENEDFRNYLYSGTPIFEEFDDGDIFHWTDEVSALCGIRLS